MKLFKRQRYMSIVIIPALSAAIAMGVTADVDTREKDLDSAADSKALPREPQPGFRVLPYLQTPSSQSMTIVWVSEQATAGELTLIGPQAEQRQFVSEPRPLALMQYSDAELKQEIPGLETGSWLFSSSNYQHIVRIDGLQPGQRYFYRVNQDGIQHLAAFNTAPSKTQWDHIRLVAFSDTETEPAGRIQHREWETAYAGLAEGSAARPGIDSLWSHRYGTAVRYGQESVRYPLSQASALHANIRTITEQDPDLLLIAGDLVQGAGYQPSWDEFWRHFAGELSDFASHVPLVTALGNWETFAGISGGYGSADDRTPPVIARNRYHEYMVTSGDSANPQFADS